jgi:hypothetical protein
VRFLKKINEEFGKKAGKVWRVINTFGNINEPQLLQKTKLNENNLFAAIGWLARENKICKIDQYYALGETNLTDEIGQNAGKIWNLLHEHGEIDVSSICKFSKISEKDIFSALGWLARENKIEAKKKVKTKQLSFSIV